MAMGNSKITDVLQTKIDSRLQNFTDEALRICSSEEKGREETEKLILTTVNVGAKSLMSYLAKKLTEYPVFLEDDPSLENVEPLKADTQVIQEKLPSWPPKDEHIPEGAFSL